MQLSCAQTAQKAYSLARQEANNMLTATRGPAYDNMLRFVRETEREYVRLTEQKQKIHDRLRYLVQGKEDAVSCLIAAGNKLTQAVADSGG